MKLSLFNIDVSHIDEDYNLIDGFSIIEIETRKSTRCLFGITHIEDSDIYISIFWVNFYI